MATAGKLLAWQDDAQPVGRYQCAVLWSLVAVAVGCCIYIVEKFILRLDHRFVENPVDVMLRALAIAHFLVAWLYLFTSPTLRNPSAALRLTGWTALALAGCYFYHLGGAGKNPLLLLTFYTLFLIHEIHDQTDLFLMSQPASLNRPVLLGWVRATLILVLMTVLLGGNLIHAAVYESSPALEKVSAKFLAGSFALLVVATSAASVFTFVRARQEFGTLGNMTRSYAPLLAIYFSISAILLVGSLFGSFGFNFTVLVHVMTWLVFVRRRLADSPSRVQSPVHGPVQGLWTWFRSTPTGFLTLHLGLALAVLILLGLRVHAWGKVGIVSQALASSNFAYWTILHIVMSFYRK